MKHTEVVSYLVNALKEASLITYNKDFLECIGVPSDTLHIKRLSGYLNRSGSIRDRQFLKAIEERFGFDQSLWKICESSQMQRIKEAIQNELDLQELPNEEALDISDIIHTKKPITQEQLALLDEFSSLTERTEEESMIDKFLSARLLEKKLENQEFLVELLKLAYAKGLYAIMVEFIFPGLYPSYRQLPEVQEAEAHTLGSLGEFNEAKHILNILIHHNTIENINLRTSALSNHRRALLQPGQPISEDDLYALTKGYRELHAIKGIYSYYTGINLLYMVTLGKILFPDNRRFFAIDAQEIYNKSKPSLKKDKTHHDYFAAMSSHEFKLLLGYEGVLDQIESFLEHYAPHPSLVERTVRQMKIIILSADESNDPLVEKLTKCVAILEGYMNTREM